MSAYTDKIASLRPEAHDVICNQATEAPFSGEYNDGVRAGTYLCRRCGLALFRTPQQFNAGCGWPSFDGFISGTVAECSDPDGLRTEICCSRCQAHLGHVFRGERFTVTNQRYCVNALSLDFVADPSVMDTDEAVIAGGCFWGVDYYLRQLPGVLKVEVGYTHGALASPSYTDVCRGNTGHYEAVRVVFDTAKVDYRQVLQEFFEIHDPTEKEGQGADRGLQYQSAVFYYNSEQLSDAQTLLALLQSNGYSAATVLHKASIFWKAEPEHQAYYSKHPSVPYCHRKVKRFS
jgi:peptide methionine sulfoxide reductase msrA/msrB